jgi:hypothetical protein
VADIELDPAALCGQAAGEQCKKEQSMRQSAEAAAGSRGAMWWDKRCGTRRMNHTQAVSAPKPQMAAIPAATASMVSGAVNRIAMSAPSQRPT